MSLAAHIVTMVIALTKLQPMRKLAFTGINPFNCNVPKQERGSWSLGNT
jgi:hypothetical protein